MASGDLNEYRINELMNKGAPIDLFAVGTELVTSRDDPAMNGVYKLVAMRVPQSSPSQSLVASDKRTKVNNCNDENKKPQLIYKIKTSPGKKTYPGPKQIHRILENNLIKVDLITLEDEVMNNNINSIPLLRKYIEHGKIIEEKPLIQTLQGFHLQQLSTLPSKFKNLEHVPETFPVKFSKKLVTLLNEASLERE
jgi:nicotinate phosphoribosyltransferase